ncbi:MAG: hypothetical protein M3354_01475, partial [Chloroflexota bacterium]|nr:hypothetical protein [Chloroflexota bacterium]
MSPEEDVEQAPVAPARKKTTRTPRPRQPKAEADSAPATAAPPSLMATATTVIESEAIDRQDAPDTASVNRPQSVAASDADGV